MSFPPPRSPRPRPGPVARMFPLVFVVAEIAAVVGVIYVLGWGWAALLGLATTVLGAVLLRVNGMRTMREYRDALEAGRPPGNAVVSGSIGVVGAILLLAPGFATDAVGLLCVFPPTRWILKPLVNRFLESRLDSPTVDRLFGPRVVHTEQGPPRADDAETAADTADADEVLEGEIVDGDGRSQ